MLADSGVLADSLIMYVTKNYLSQRPGLSIYFLVITMVRMSFCVHGELGGTMSTRTAWRNQTVT